jgi:hypothetical protein
MKIVATVDDEDQEVVAIQTRYFLEGVTSVNRWLMRKRHLRIPPLYESGVRFRLEPWADDVQFFANVLEVIEQGWGDCKMLCAWRCAELREQRPHETFGFKLYWREVDADPLHAALGRKRIKYDVYHVQIRLPGEDEPVEDVSRFLHQ